MIESIISIVGFECDHCATLQIGTPDNTLASPTPAPINKQVPVTLIHKIITRADTLAETPNFL